jgi:hypothetical protein
MNVSVRWLVRITTLAMLRAPIIFAASPEPAHPAAGKPDLTGVWIGMSPRNAAKAYANTPYPNPAPFTEEGKRWSEYWSDPHHNLGARCIPWTGAQGVMNAGTYFPVEIIQKDKQVTLVNEYLSQVRRVYLDGRPHPANLDKSWFGHSIGHWEGTTLVVDTVGGHAGPLNGSGATVGYRASDAEPRMPYSEALHLVEHIQLLEAGKYLEDDVTIDDPVIYTHAFTVRRFWRRAPELEVLEYVCTENMRPQDEGLTDTPPTPPSPSPSP